MKARAQKDGGVNRLTDMVVEEVSLVDRAANKRRYLVVKRDESMDEDTEIDKVEGDEPGSDDTTGELSAGSPLDAALTALESLTSIVEVLGSLGANRADTRLAELAHELRDTADQILGQAEPSEPAGDNLEPTDPFDDTTTHEGNADGLNPDAQAKAANVPAKQRGKTPPKPPKKPAKKPKGPEDAAPATTDEEPPPEDAVNAAKSALADIGKLLRKALAPQSSPSVQHPPTPPELTTSITQLTEAVAALTKSVTEQQQRLGRVEKQFGLPNSAPAAETISKADDSNVGWPLDLNHPMDRQSVDKSVSFHDL